ncbi:GntR family transcriptional regulator [Streptomyces lavendulae]|uniref:GntR family transcriptional regulator n=1 Tax=Streptomyces lavendulae TaxID=1914 RepID=UPI003676228C
MLSETAAVLLMRCDTGRYRTGLQLPTAADLAAQLAVPVTEVTIARTQLSGYGVLTEHMAGDGHTVTPRGQWTVDTVIPSKPAQRAACLLRTGLGAGRYRAGAVLPPEPHLWQVVGIRASHRREAHRILACEGLVTVPVGGAPPTVRPFGSVSRQTFNAAPGGPTLGEAAVAALLVRGATNEEIANRLRISRFALYRHLERIDDRFHAVSRVNRVHAILSGGWSVPPPGGPAPDFDRDDLLLLRALAEQPDRAAVGNVMVGATSRHTTLTEWIRELVLRSGARCEEHLVALGHTWGLLGTCARPDGPPVNAGRASQTPSALPLPPSRMRNVQPPRPSLPPQTVREIASRIVEGAESGRYAAGILLSRDALAADLNVAAPAAGLAIDALLADGTLQPLRNGATPAAARPGGVSPAEYLAARIRDQIGCGLYPPGRPLAQVVALSKHFATSPHPIQAAVRILLAKGTLARVRGGPYRVLDGIHHTESVRIPLPVPTGPHLGPEETHALIRSARARWRNRSYTPPETLQDQWEQLRRAAAQVLEGEDGSLPALRLHEAATLPAPVGSYLRQWHNAVLATALHAHAPSR